MIEIEKKEHITLTFQISISLDFGLQTHRRISIIRKFYEILMSLDLFYCKLVVINKSRFAWSDYLLNSCLLPHGELNANVLVLFVIFLVFLGLKGPRFTGLLISSALRTTIASSNLPNDVMSCVFSSSSSLLSLISIAEECPLTSFDDHSQGLYDDEYRVDPESELFDSFYYDLFNVDL